MQRLVAGGGGLADQPPLVADQHDQEDGQGDDAGAPGDHSRRDQGVLASPQLGQGGGRLRLFAGRQRDRRLPQVDVGRVDPLQVDLVGRPHVVGVDRVQHLVQQLKAGRVLGLDLSGLGGVVGPAVGGQLAQGDLKGPAGLLQGRPQLGIGGGKVGMPKGMLLVDLVARFDPGVALGADALDLSGGTVDSRRRPDRASGQPNQYCGQAGRHDRDQPAALAIRLSVRPMACAVRPDHCHSSPSTHPRQSSRPCTRRYRLVPCAVERFAQIRDHPVSGHAWRRPGGSGYLTEPRRRVRR